MFELASAFATHVVADLLSLSVPHDEARRHLPAYLVQLQMDYRYHTDDPWAYQQLRERDRGGWYFEGATLFFSMESTAGKPLPYRGRQVREEIEVVFWGNGE
jgi:hypothetical protein